MPDPAKQWHPSTPAISADQFPDVIEGPITIIHFWAPWNPHDKALDSALAPLRPTYQRIRFFCANFDDTSFNPIIDAHHIGVLPTLLCFANGRSRGRFQGLQTPEALKSFLDEMTQPPQR